MGWVQLFLILHLHKLCVHEVVGQPQLWEWGRVGVAQADQAWEPDRKAKSLAFLGKDEDPGKVTEQDTNSVESEKPKDTKVPKKAKLNVSDKDSPYALIDQYFPERESYFYQNKNKFLSEYNDHGQGKKTDIGNSDPSEVWLADDNLLVLKGGSTPDRDGYDNPWEPIDDFQAPYREPVLPPPDFDPDSLEIGVGVPIETIIEERAKEKKKHKAAAKTFSNFDIITKEELSANYYPTPELEEIPQLINPDNALKPYKDEVIRSQDEFKKFFNDVSQFINDMENFHPARQASPPHVVDKPSHWEPPRSLQTTPKPTVPSTEAAQFLLKTTRAIKQQNSPHQEKDFPSPSPWQSNNNQRQLPPVVTWSPPPAKQEQTTSYPLSYSSPYSKVFLSSNYISKLPITTPPPPVKLSISPKYAPQHRSQQARSTQRPTTTPAPVRTYTFSPTITPAYKERRTTVRYTTTSPIKVRSPTLQPSYYNQLGRNNVSSRVMYSSPQYQDSQDWLPVTTPAPRHRDFQYNPSPTPYSLFQSVPENIRETDVFHLSQNVDFGKKIETDNPVLNEVDTGYRVPMSLHKLASTRPPRKVTKARGALDGLIPALFSHKRDENRSRKSRGRSTVRRRRPKHVQPAADRQGNGDVRYVSFYSGGSGGNSWGYSYNLGK